MKKILLLQLLWAVPFVSWGQEKFKKEPGVMYYDDWPVTIKANGERLKEKMIQPNFVPIGSTWGHRVIRYFFVNGTADMAGNTERDAVRQGFEIWTAHTGLAFIEVCNAVDADILISWAVGDHGDGAPFDGTNGVLAHAQGPPPLGNGDIHFDDDETWTDAYRTGGTQPVDLITVAAHEIGHALGLDHTTVGGSLMLATYTGSHRYLGSDDIAGIQSLYGSGSLISGLEIFCSGTTTYSFPGLPAGYSLSWSTQGGSPLSINASTGVATYINDGVAEIIATIGNGCSSTQVRRKVQVGAPAYTHILAESGYIGTGQRIIDLCNLPTPAEVTYTGPGFVSEYEWSIWDHSDWDIIRRSTGWKSVEIDYWKSPANNPQKIYIRGRNTCGWGLYAETFWQVQSCLMSFNVFPNPASDELILEFEKIPDTEQLPEQLQLFSEKSAIPVRSFNRKQLSSLRSGTGGNRIGLNVKELPRGVYFLHSKQGEKTEKTRVILK